MSSAKFNILIVGSGLGGLVTALALLQKGHKVTLLESTSQLQTIGGGISIQPSSMRCLDQLGIAEKVRVAGEVKEHRPPQMVRYDNGELLMKVVANTAVYGYDQMNIHRARLQKVLVDEVTAAGGILHTGTRVLEFDDKGPSPSVTTKDGKKWEADLIVGADGVNSTIRKAISGDIPLITSVNSYKAVIPGSLLREDPELAPLTEHTQMWWGPSRMLIGLSVQGGASYAINADHPGDTGTAGDWSQKGDVAQMQATFADFDEKARKILKYVKEEDLFVWKLVQLPELKTWSSESGKVVLTGDAAHAMVPYSGHGHAMAVEDALSLAECLAKATSPSDIPRAVKAFEAIRKPRTSQIGAYSLRNQHVWLLPDGPEQQKRDEMFKKIPIGGAPGWDGQHVDEFPGFLPNPKFFPWLMGHDSAAFTKRKLEDLWN